MIPLYLPPQTRRKGQMRATAACFRQGTQLPRAVMTGRSPSRRRNGKTFRALY